MQFKTLSGLILPYQGFGTYKLKGHSGVGAIVESIEQGYRLVDTAYNYENEGAVGKAIKESKINRDKLIVTSKLPGRYQKHDDALQAIEESLYRLDLDYIDLYLIHWPNPKENLYVEAWKTLIEAKQKGLVKHIGVCNFLQEHIERLETETGCLPDVNQIELHPYFQQDEMLAFNQSKQIVTEAWSPLGRKKCLEEPIIIEIAKKHQKSTSQIILRWHFQRSVLAIPKSSERDRQLQNLSILDFELDQDDLNKIKSLDRKNGRLNNQDPAVYEEF